LRLFFSGLALPTGESLFARVRRLDDLSWLDPADLAGSTWRSVIPVAGWPLVAASAPYESAPGWEGMRGYEQDHLLTLPTDAWPDELDLAVYVHRRADATPGGRNLRVAWQAVRFRRERPVTVEGEIRVPIEYRVRP
jgi:hypothetical protein